MGQLSLSSSKVAPSCPQGYRSAVACARPAMIELEASYRQNAPRIFFGTRIKRTFIAARRTHSSILQFDTGPQRPLGHFVGGEKINFLSRDTDDTAMAGMSVATCQFVVSRSLGGRSRSIPYTCNRLRRLRRRFPA